MGFLVFLAIVFFVVKFLQAISSENSSSAQSEDVMEALRLRFNNKKVDDNGREIIVKEIEGKGLFPISRPIRIGFVTSVFDEINGELEPVISLNESFQEPTNVTYQHILEVGTVSQNQGFIKWVTIGLVIPDILQPPYGGNRNLCAFVRMIDMDNPPKITHGFHEDNHPGLLWQHHIEFKHHFSERGYIEAADLLDECRAIVIKVAIAVAMSEGDLSDSKGEVIKKWIVSVIELFSSEKREDLKTKYNNIMREAYASARTGVLSLSESTKRLNEIGEGHIKYDAIELCYDVITADGIAVATEVQMIRKIAESLDLDMNEVEKVWDKKIIASNLNISKHESVEDILGIDPTWTTEQIKKHLRTEFLKWNNRLNTLPSGDERDSAQRMLDIIADARKKNA